MRVLYLSPPARRAGTKLGRYSFLHEEIEGLAGRGLEVFILAHNPAPPVPRGVQVQTIGETLSAAELRGMVQLLASQAGLIPGLHLLKPRTLLQALRIENLAARTIRAHQIDVIHSHFGWPKGFGGLLASRATGAPLAASLHGADVLVDRTIGYGRRRDRGFARAIRVLLANASRTIYYSDFMRKEGLRLGARVDSARVIYWGTDVEAFAGNVRCDELRAELGLQKAPMLLAVAGLIERKGVDKVLQALALLQEKYAFTFVVCGDGPELNHLQQLTETIGLRDRVRFAGRIDRALMPKYFAAADVFLHGALTEAAGIVLIEAMASGCPVVCTDAGGPAEYVEHGVTGFVVPVGDSVAMASRIAWLLDHPEEAARFGEAGRRRAVERFGRQRMLDEVIAEYDELASSRDPHDAAAVPAG